MADFDQLRQQQRAARNDTAQKADALFMARERLGRLESRGKELARTIGKDAAEQQLAGLQAKASKDVDDAKNLYDGALKNEAGFAGQLAALIDPRDAMQRLDDSIPILMFPLRLETRFRPNELCVRVYPDDCSVDTFEPTISESELQNVRTYWAGIFQAGRISDQERGAWRALSASHGPGRAEWLIGQHVPSNLDTRKAKGSAGDVILTIVIDEPAPPGDAGAIENYWIKVWQDGDDAAAALLPAGRLDEVRARYAPTNISQKGKNVPQVEWVLVPQVDIDDLRRRTWARAASVTTLPDCFVFIGYNPGQQPYVQVGKPVPASLDAGPDPSAPKDEQLQQDKDGELIFPDGMKWMVDFDRAVNAGMGFRVDLTKANAANGFARVIVTGVRVTDDPDQGRERLETLITHHRFSRSGFELVPQGTPTNNTDNLPSGWSRDKDADEAFDLLGKTSLFTMETDWLKKSDGQWLAEYLGIDPAALQRVMHADGRDQTDARAMNTALWPATLGYWMESMMRPGVPFSDKVVAYTRDFLTRFVSGRGAVPAVRIGKQPYGILPASALSHLTWVTNPKNATESPQFAYLRGLHRLLWVMNAEWEQMRKQVSFAGKSGDPHQTLLDIVGLHSGSAELWQRWSESLAHLQGILALFDPQLAETILEKVANDEAMTFLRHLAGPNTIRDPELLHKFFFGKQNRADKPVDTVPLSETAPLTVTRADGKNYIEWLIDAAGTSLGTLYAQEGFGGKVPNALLYIMLRHALQLGYSDASLKLHVTKNLMSDIDASAARIDSPFINIDAQQAKSESRYAYLFKKEPQITGNAQMRVDEYIASSLKNLAIDWPLKDQIAALQELADASTARLERAFFDHLDTCSYRLDAWMLGFLHMQLARMRRIEPDPSGLNTVKRGIYLGAYGWVEDLRPEKKTLTPVQLTDADLQTAFGGAPALMRDSNNFGYVHAPSLNQAVAAAILRNGYKQSASPETRDTLAVNLTSERVRAAMAMIEGIRNGQSLGALLGYQFERGLHDRYNEAEVDKFIYDIRAKFPLAGNQINSTKLAALRNVREVEARNVVDGLKLIEHIAKTGKKTYPFGFADLESASATEADAIDKEVERMRETHDAVSDLATAEGVYQAVLGNYDRAGSTYDAYAKGTLPPEPQVVRTPASGKALTHRVALHLDPNAPAGSTPRSIAEPSLNQWIAGVLPPLNGIGCKVHYLDADDRVHKTAGVTLSGLGLEPRDLLELVHDGTQAMNELDDRITRVAVDALHARPDEPVTIEYRKFDVGIPIFEVMPLVRSLRTLFDAARPLRPTDLTLSSESATSADDTLAIDASAVTAARAQLDACHTLFDSYITPRTALLNDPVANRAAIVANIDSDIAVLIPALADAALFGIPQTGWGVAYEGRRGIYRSILEKVAAAAQKLADRQVEFNDVMATLPSAADDAARMDVLYRAERLISTSVKDAATPLELQTDLTTVKLSAFQVQLAALENVQNTNARHVSDLLSAVKALPPLAPFTFDNLSFTDEEDSIVTLAEDLLRLATAVQKEVKKRYDDAGAHIAEANGKALDAAAKTMFGEHFTVIPRFSLDAKRGAEIDQSLAKLASGALLGHLAAAPYNDPLPRDTWLYGIARVRDKMRAWEQAVMLSEAFLDVPPNLALDPLQFPVVDGEMWLGLDFPQDFKIDGERLLYTASFSVPFDKNSTQCGVLLDEWSEVIPQPNLDTGLTFHFDRPNNEAPQAMLLVTPSDVRGKWIWSDVVDALNDTLDFAKRRAVEPDQLHATQYARFLPATTMAVTYGQLSISAAMIEPNLQVKQI